MFLPYYLANADFSFPDQLRAAGIVNQARIGCVSATPLGSLSGSRKRAPTDDGSMSPESSLQRQRQNVEDLRTEVLELQIQADRAKRIRLEKEKETEALARQARQEWAELELAKANLEREVAEEHSRAVVQEVRCPVTKRTAPLIYLRRRHRPGYAVGPPPLRKRTMHSTNRHHDSPVPQSSLDGSSYHPALSSACNCQQHHSP